jgi:hypothetical protein
MHPEAPGVRVTSRAGHVARLEMPIIFLSEINGTTYLVKAGVATPLPGLQLELKDVAGKVVKRLRSAYDGFYTFGDLPAGSYTLGVAEAGAQRLGVPTPPPRPLNLAPEGSILDGVDFRIEMR